MKKLALIIALLSTSVFASDLENHFNNLVKPSADQGEFSLHLKVTKDGNTSDALKEILTNLTNVEDIDAASVSVEKTRKPVQAMEEAMRNLGLTNDGFYCNALKGFNEMDDYETGKCGEIMRQLLLPFFETKGLYRVKTIYVEANNWGDWIHSHLIMESQTDLFVFDFDIVHEI